MNEEVFHNHICSYLTQHFGYRALSATDMADKVYYFIESHLTAYIQQTQATTWKELQDDYFGSDTANQILKAIKADIAIKPLWLVIRDGVEVKGKRILLYTPRPRNNNNSHQAEFQANIFAYKKEFYFTNDTIEAIDLVIYLNGLPIITCELKHQGKTGIGSTYADAIAQYSSRRFDVSKIFSLAFAHFAADTDEVKVATNPSDDKFFQPFNTGLNNVDNPDKPTNEYPVWHLYGQAFSPEYISDFIEYFLVYVPVNAEKQTPAFTIMPRFHQLRSTRNVTAHLLNYAETTDLLGKKFLINHSPGAGKTLTIGWLAERLDTLNKSTNNEKLLDAIFILTDRTSLNKNVKDDLELFTHLKRKILFTEKAADIVKGLKEGTNIIVTTIQQFNYVQQKLKEEASFKNLKVAFLIDEAHRSQGSKMGMNVRTAFTNDDDETSWEDEAAEAFKNLDISRQVYVAFTATPTEKTINLFGAPFDVYTEDEAIKEGYILDVADNIISYSTLYHLTTTLKKPDESLFPHGLVTKLLRDIAFEDKSIIDYKSLVIIEHFENEVKTLLEGKAKAMVVTTSRQAGYNYFLALKDIIDKRNLGYKVIFAFTDFIEKESKLPLTEAKVNNIEITEETPIETYFEKDEYKILIVANKFQQGFDEPLLCAMYLDKVVKGVNAVQTISRLNRKYPGKNKTTVIDFTNNATEIFKAFSKYRKGAKVRNTNPDPQELEALYNQIMVFNVFSQDMIDQYIETAQQGDDAMFSMLSATYRRQFEKTIPLIDERKTFVNKLLTYVKKYNFFAQFTQFNDTLTEFALFADLVAGKLIKLGSESNLKKALKNITVEKATVNYLGETQNPNIIPTPKTGGSSSNAVPPPKVTIEEILEDIKLTTNIQDGDEIIIKEIYVDTMENEDLLKLIFANKDNHTFLQQTVAAQVRQMIIDTYKQKGQIRKTREPLYKDAGGIFDLLVQNIIRYAIYKIAN